MLKFIDIKMNEIKPGCTSISLKFDDREVIQEKFLFLRERLKSLECYMNDEYSIKLGFQYDEYPKHLLIDVTILTPDHLMPKDFEEAIKIFMDHLGTFEKFYEAQCLIFDKSCEKTLRC